MGWDEGVGRRSLPSPAREVDPAPPPGVRRCADVNIAAATLVVRRGKSRLEEAECREVPLSRLRCWLGKPGSPCGTPPNRKQARPEHAFRAAFQAHQRLAGVAEPGIDALVGHDSSTTRAPHHAGIDTLVPPMRGAVDALPPVDGSGPGAGGRWLCPGREERSVQS